jgi:hypothetical protein
MDQWNGIEGTEINPCSYSDLIFNKGAQSYVEEKTASSINGTGKKISTCRRLKLDPYL